MIKNTTWRQKLCWVLFIIYLVSLGYFLFFAESFGRVPGIRHEYAYNLVLFREIRRFFWYRDLLGTKAFMLNMVGNVVAFLPFGFILPVISRRGRRWYNTILLSFLFSLCIETVQLVFKVGSFDVDDMFLNTLGGICGFIGYKTVQTIRIRRRLHGKEHGKNRGESKTPDEKKGQIQR